jgi:hypothetical protein
MALRTVLLDGVAALPHAAGMAVDDHFRGFLTMQARGVLALPPEVRRRWHLDRPGAQVRPHLPVPVTQDWFWAPDWQRRESEADEDVRARLFTEHADVDDFLGSLNP